MRGSSLGIWRFFLVSRPLRLAAAIVTSIVAVSIVAIGLMQGLQRSEDQYADQLIGAADGVVNVSGAATLGVTYSGSIDASVNEALSGLGLDAERTGWQVFQVSPDGAVETVMNLEEDDWGVDPFPVRLRLDDGRWPTSSDQVAVADPLAGRYPLGSRIAFFGGAIDAEVVGVVRDDFARDAETVFLAPSTMSVLIDHDDTALRDRGIRAQRNVFYDGLADGLAVQEAIDSAASWGDDVSAIVFARDPASAAPADYAEQRLAALIVPVLGGFVAATIAARFVRRIRHTMWTIGVSHRSTRSAALAAVAAAIGIGALAGIATGILLLLVGRAVLDAFVDTALSPTREPLLTAAIAVGGIAVGAVIGWLLGRRPSRDQDRVHRTPGTAWAYATLAVAVAFLLLGVTTVRGTRNPDTIILGATCIGVAIVVPCVILFRQLTRLEPGSFAVRLAARRLRADTSSRIAMAGTGVLLLIAFGSATLINSAIAETNATNLSPVPPGQIWITVPDDRADARDRVVSSIHDALDLDDPIRVDYLDQSALTAFEGAVFVVDDVAAAERLLKTDLDQPTADALEAGAALRLNHLPAPQMQFLDTAGGAVDVEAVTTDGLDPTFGNYAGLLLRTTVSVHAFALARTDFVFTGVSDAQQSSADATAQELGFNRTWVTVFRTPDPFDIPLPAFAVTLGVTILNGIILTWVSISDARQLRPVLASLRAVGVRRSWLRRVLLVRTLTIATFAVLAAVLAAAIAATVALAVAGIPLTTSPPWPVIIITAVTTILAGAAAALLSSRRLEVTERPIEG